MWLALSLMVLAFIAFRCEAAGPSLFFAIVLWVIHVEYPVPMADLTAVVAMFSTGAIVVVFVADLFASSSQFAGSSVDPDELERFFDDVDDDL